MKPMNHDEVVASNGQRIYFAVVEGHEIRSEADYAPTFIQRGYSLLHCTEYQRTGAAARRKGVEKYRTIVEECPYDLRLQSDGTCDLNDGEWTLYMFRSEEEANAYFQEEERKLRGESEAMVDRISETFARLGCTGVQAGDMYIPAVHPLEKMLGRKPTDQEMEIFEAGVRHGQR